MKALIFLYVIIAGYGTTPNYEKRIEMPSMTTCQDALKAMRISNTKGAENENAIVSFCGTGNIHRNFNARWWVDKVQ